jgi:hypothetical protein
MVDGGDDRILPHSDDDPPLELARPVRKYVPAPPPPPPERKPSLTPLLLGALVVVLALAWWKRAWFDPLFPHKRAPRGAITVVPSGATTSPGPEHTIAVRAPGYVPAQVVPPRGHDLQVRLGHEIATIPDGAVPRRLDPDLEQAELESLAPLPADWTGRRATLIAKAILTAPTDELADRVRTLDLTIEAILSPTLQQTARRFADLARAGRPVSELVGPFNDLVRVFDAGPEIWSDVR